MRGRGLKLKHKLRQKSIAWQQADKARDAYANTISYLMQSLFPPEKRPARWMDPFREIILDCDLYKLFNQLHAELKDETQATKAQEIIDVSKELVKTNASQMLADIRENWQVMNLPDGILPADANKWAQLWFSPLSNDLTEDEALLARRMRVTYLSGVLNQYLRSKELSGFPNEVQILTKEAEGLVKNFTSADKQLASWSVDFADNYIPELILTAWSLANAHPEQKQWLNLAKKLDKTILDCGYPAVNSFVSVLAPQTSQALESMNTFNEHTLGHVAITNTHVALNPALIPLKELQDKDRNYPLAEHLLVHEMMHLRQVSMSWNEVAKVKSLTHTSSLSEAIVELNTIAVLEQAQITTRENYNLHGTGYILDVALAEEVYQGDLKSIAKELLSFTHKELYDWQMTNMQKHATRTLKHEDVLQFNKQIQVVKNEFNKDLGIDVWRKIVRDALANL